MIRHALRVLVLTFRHWSWPLLAVVQGLFVFLLAAGEELGFAESVGWLTVQLSLLALLNAHGTTWRDRTQGMPTLPMSRRSRALGDAVGGLVLPVIAGLAGLTLLPTAPEGSALPIFELLPAVVAVTTLRHMVREVQSLAIVVVPGAAFVLALLTPLGPLGGAAGLAAVIVAGPALVRSIEQRRLPVRRTPRARALPGALDDVVRGWFVGAGIALVMGAPLYVVAVVVDLRMAGVGLLGLVLAAVVAGPHIRPAGLHVVAEGRYSEALDVLPIPRARIVRTAWLAGMVANAVLLAVSLGTDLFLTRLMLAGGLFACSITAWRMFGEARPFWLTAAAIGVYLALVVALPIGAVLVDFDGTTPETLMLVAGWIPLVVPLLAALSPLPRLRARRA